MYKQNLKGTIKHTANCAYYNYQIIFVHKIIYLTLSTYLDTLYITKLIVSTTKHLTLYIINYTVQTVLNTMIYKCNNFRNKKKKNRIRITQNSPICVVQHLAKFPTNFPPCSLGRAPSPCGRIREQVGGNRR